MKTYDMTTYPNMFITSNNKFAPFDKGHPAFQNEVVKWILAGTNDRRRCVTIQVELQKLVRDYEGLHHRYGLFHSELEIMPAELKEAFADDPEALFNLGNICQHLQDISSSFWLARIIKYLDQFGFSLPSCPFYPSSPIHFL
ncbi:hypothetical protein NMY22_g903 [Coprinellus aureogranulatus]|nr:hypothetical protein NMY22_g903 [Coprinellus aureogranulatus]